ncbi:ribonuclease FAU-1 family protein [Flindersiella endophytica]
MTTSVPARFEPGSVAVRRNVYRGKVRSAWPMRVVSDDGSSLVLSCWEGTELTSESGNAAAWRNGDRQDSRHIRSVVDQSMSELVAGDWTLGTSVLGGVTLLGAQLPDVWFSVLLFFREDGEFAKWYVNFERPYRRTPVGVDTWDLTIDLIFNPDGTHRWKDVEEYAQARHLGIITDAEHAEVEDAKEQAFAMFEHREGPFEERWLGWQRNPDWPIPTLPEGALAVPAAG